MFYILLLQLEFRHFCCKAPIHSTFSICIIPYLLVGGSEMLVTV